MIEIGSKEIKSFDDLDEAQTLAAKYKSLRYQVSDVFPKLTYLSGSVAKGNPTSLFFNEEIRNAITETGKRELERIRIALLEYGITV